MAQVKVDTNVYFQQHGNQILGVYVNMDFVTFEVKRELEEKELQELANKIYKICLETPCIKETIDSYIEEYKDPKHKTTFINLCK